MPSLYSSALFRLDPEAFRDSFDRKPLGFDHSLSGLDLFEFDSLRALAGKYQRGSRDYYVAASAPSPGTEFYSVPRVAYNPCEAIEHLESGAYRVLLKRPENFDPRFRELLDALFQQVVDLRGGPGGEQIVRLESAILISSAAATTPFHFDPEIGFFSQIEGEKIYHVYSPTAVTEAELERLYRRGVVDIGQLDLKGRDPSHEHVFALGPGSGLHQPQNAPHWVETRDSRSISYTFVFETSAMRARGRVRAFNHYLRKLGLSPSVPGSRPALEAAKSGTMQVVTPVRRGVESIRERGFRKTISKVLRR